MMVVVLPRSLRSSPGRRRESIRHGTVGKKGTSIRGIKISRIKISLVFVIFYFLAGKKIKGCFTSATLTQLNVPQYCSAAVVLLYVY